MQRHLKVQRGWSRSSTFPCQGPTMGIAKPSFYSGLKPRFLTLQDIPVLSAYRACVSLPGDIVPSIRSKSMLESSQIVALMTRAVLRSSRCRGPPKHWLILLLPREYMCELKPTQSGGTNISCALRWYVHFNSDLNGNDWLLSLQCSLAFHYK